MFGCWRSTQQPQGNFPDKYSIKTREKRNDAQQNTAEHDNKLSAQ